MKFSLVFVVLSVLFALSFGLPANWEEEDLVASNENAVQDKRFISAALLLAKKTLLKSAIRAACNWSKLPSNLKGLCACASMVGRDEEFPAEENKRWWFFNKDALSKLKSTANSICNSKLKYVLGGPCDCLKPFI